MKKVIAVAFVLCFYTTSGCVPAIIVGAAYHGAKSKESEQQFNSSFNQTNADRESKGLTPLDWCTEAYRWNKSYARKDKNCKKRTYAYEKGDSTAIGNTMTQEQIDALPEPPKRTSSKR